MFSLPTATAAPLQTGTWAAGVGGVVVKMAGPFVLGGLVSQFWRQFLPEKAIDNEQFVDPAETIESQMPQAAADRIADEQRPREHRRRRCDAKGDCGVDSPVKGEAGQNEAKRGHAGRDSA